MSLGEKSKSIERLGLLSVLLLAAWMRLWHLQLNGFGNDYYAAAVRSMLQNRHNFFFVSFDPAGWVTVDKPPLALWIQALSAKVFGFSSLSLLVPQALEGVLGVALLYALVRRSFDPAAALLAALVLALSPVSVAVDRYNNVDACLILVLLLAATALFRALEKGSVATLLLAAVLMGLGFNTKMLAAFTVLPAFFLLYALAGPGGAWSRARALGLAALVLAVVSLSWPLAVDLTPAQQRPYVGSTPDNSMLELSLGWNGLQRFSGRRRAGTPDKGLATSQEAALERTGAAPRGRNAGQGRMGAGEPGPLRLAQAGMAGQVLWFLPLVLLGWVAAWRSCFSDKALRRAAAGGPQKPPKTASNPLRHALLFWGAWLGVCGAVLSALRVMHPYYLVLLAPPLAALSGIGLRALWLEYRDGRRGLLPMALLLTALWQAATLLQTPGWSGALMPSLALGAALAALILALAQTHKSGRPGPEGPQWPSIGLAVGLLALLLCPLAWALTPVLSPKGDHAVQADPALLTGSDDSAASGRFGGQDAPGVDRRLLAFLEQHRGKARYLVAADNSQAVGPLIIASGEPAIAVGGFMGSDPIVDVPGFARMVQSGELRYFLLSPVRDRPGHGNAGSRNWPVHGLGAWAGGRSQPLDAWVRKHGQLVPPSLWRSPQAEPLYRFSPAGRGWGAQRGRNLELYELSVAQNQSAKTRD